MSQTKWLSFIIIAVFLASCTTSSERPSRLQDVENLTVYSASVEPSHEIAFQKEIAFGENDTLFIGRLTDVAVDEKGRVYLADDDQLNIKVYSSDGTFLTLLGRSGKGPGEFIDLFDMEISEKYLFAYDRDQQRTAVFSLDSLTYSYTVNLATNRDQYPQLNGAYLGEIYIRDNGSFLVSFTKNKISEKKQWYDTVTVESMYYRLNREGKIVSDKLFEFTSSVQVLFPHRRLGFAVATPVQYLGKGLTVLSEQGTFYRAWSKDFVVQQYKLNGQYRRSFYHSVQRIPLTKAYAASFNLASWVEDVKAHKELPDYWPVLHSLLPGAQNRLWASVYTASADTLQWWVMKPNGQLLAQFKWPINKKVAVVKNGKLYAIKTDSLGVQHIIRYDIKLTEK